jgi:TRAP-type uncharacterized transport system fused permease subunit
MIDPELKTELDKINRSLVGIFHKTENLWRAFIRGMLQGLGSIIGIVLAVVLIGWILNVVGVIPGLRQQAGEWKAMWQDTLEQVRKIR